MLRKPSKKTYFKWEIINYLLNKTRNDSFRNRTWLFLLKEK